MFNRYDGLVAQTTDTSPPPTNSFAVTEHILQTLYMLGDGTDMAAAAPPNNQLVAPEALTFSGPFILVSNGPDKKWGRDTTNGIDFTYKKRSDSDDVYNFER